MVDDQHLLAVTIQRRNLVIRDDEGYASAMRDGRWVIVDRYGEIAVPELWPSSGEAQKRADEMNDDVIARRLADSMRRRK